MGEKELLSSPDPRPRAWSLSLSPSCRSVNGLPCRDVSLLRCTRSLLDAEGETWSGGCSERDAPTEVRGMAAEEEEGWGEEVGMHAVSRLTRYNICM